jgi:imidazolonepropionase-like amidohydrolase
VTALLLQNALVFDGHSPELLEGAEVVVTHGRIAEINPKATRSNTARVVDLKGAFLMPGLIDAHFHAYGADVNLGRVDQMPKALRALHARQILEGAAGRGFTTVRDAGGGDLALLQATESGLIRGPRIFPAGLALSQTGGHGDFRSASAPSCCGCGYSGALSMVVDGVDEVRRAAREQLRRGATQIKLFLSGGVTSPTDPLWMNGFTDAEITAAVEEAARWRSYVMAHAHTAEAAARCAQLGIRSIEHATMLTAEAVSAIHDHGTFVVPTLSPLASLKRVGPAMGMTGPMMDKLAEVEKHAWESCAMLVASGVPLGFGTDLLGALMPEQSQELLLRREFSSSLDVLRSATRTNAKILGKEGELGTVAVGALADLIAVSGNPLRQLDLLVDPARIGLVMRGGMVLKETLAD